MVILDLSRREAILSATVIAAVAGGGGSDYGYNLLKSGGLDMATAEPYQLIIASFSKVLDQAEALL